MKALFWVGIAVLALGIASLVVPMPHRARQGVTVAGVSLNVETRNEEKVPPLLSAVMIAGGLVTMIAGKRTVS